MLKGRGQGTESAPGAGQHAIGAKSSQSDFETHALQQGTTVHACHDTSQLGFAQA